MTVTEFVEEFNKTQTKDKLIKSHIKTTYIPYEMKIALCDNIIKHSMYKEVNSKQVFVPNMPLQYMFVIRTVIEQYTDLEWSDTKNIMPEFNLLEQYDVVAYIFSKTTGEYTEVGKDYQKLKTILNMMIDDITDEERSLVPYIDTKLEAMSLMLNSLSDVINSFAEENQDKIVDFLSGNKE